MTPPRRAVAASALLVLIATCGATVPAPIAVFEAYTVLPCFRQPVLVVTPTALIALAEGERDTRWLTPGNVGGKSLC